MTGKERFLSALRLQTPDRVPYFDYFNEESIVKTCRVLYGEDEQSYKDMDLAFNTDDFRIYDLLFKMSEDLDIDGLISAGLPGLEKLKDRPEMGRDRFGNIFRLSDEGEPVPVQGAVKDAGDLASAAKARPLAADFRQLEYFKKNMPDRCMVYMMADPFKLSWRLLGGLEKLLPVLVMDPALVHKLARIGTDFLSEEITIAVEMGADAIIQDGDLADSKTTFMSPKMFREFVKPYCQELIQIAHDKGIPIIKHSDGNVTPILDDLVDAGYDGFHPVEPQSMEISEVKQRLSGKACVCGNIDCMYLLPFGRPEELTESVKQTLKIAAPGGGYICSSSNSVHPGCKGENTLAMIRAVKDYGKYPIDID